MKRRTLLLMFFLLFSISCAGKNNTNTFYNLSYKNINKVIGVWDANDPQEIKFNSKLFSWGNGIFLLNNSLIIDYEKVDGKYTEKLKITGLGVGEFYIQKIEIINEIMIKLFVERKNKDNPGDNLPFSGTITMIFQDDGWVKFDTSEYSALDLGIEKKVSGPDKIKD